MDGEEPVGADAPSGDGPLLPERIRKDAHVAGNGELLWPRPGAIEAARWMAGEGVAIWGGEVYAPRGPFTAMLVNEWQTVPHRSPDEPWLSYVRRGLVQALAAIETYSAPGGDRPLYFLAFESVAGFSGEARPRRRRSEPEGR